ncbi:MAG: Rrf2 family transcriptional regulator [Acidimicrobiales bacterium]
MRLALTKRSGDAIRILLHLASMPAGTRQTSAELAEASGVSQGNIPTLVAALSRAGLLDCARGPGGGCALARDPADIDMAEAVTAVEGTLEAERCALDEVRCGDRAYPCGLHQTWTAIVSNLSDQLAGLSLAQALDRDVANRKAAAGQLTQAPRRPRS